MKKLDLVILEGQLHRVLSIKEDKCLVINCIKFSMPFWTQKSYLEEKENLTLETVEINSLSPTNKKKAYERYGLIAPIIPLVEDDYMRSHIISRISEDKEVSKQTLRKYLCLYLVYQSIGSLAPKEHKVKPLTQDEKNFRWALNKFYYSPLKHSLKGSYLLMLRNKYTNEDGSLNEIFPPFHRFKYFYKKTKNPQSECISRYGLNYYKRNQRPLVGGGVLEFTNSIGVGMLDSTILDIYLVNDANELIGRPILTTCVDAYSGLCCGYALTWEGGFFSIKKLLHNIIYDKVELCKSFGITINQDDWNCDKLPYTFLTDKGKEYTSYALEQLTELGVNIVNLPPYRPDLKSCVEQFFNVIQNLYKPYLKGKGVIEEDFQERGVVDYRKTASLTLKQFETILLKCIIYYNTQRVVKRVTYDKENPIKPYANEIWNESLKEYENNLILVDNDLLSLTLLPRDKAKFSRKGLCFRKLHYCANGFANEYLKGDSVGVAYNPDNTSTIWLIRKGEYIPFSLIETFKDTSFDLARTLIDEKDNYLKSFEVNQLEARVSLISDIEDIARISKQGVTTKSIRKTRSKEKAKERRVI